MTLAIAVIWLHWVADFILQTNTMATNKSTSHKWLAAHVSIYTLALLLFGWKYALLNGAAHFCIDAITSRMTSYFWGKAERHMFFVVIGLDQAAHLTCLLLTLPLASLWWLP